MTSSINFPTYGFINNKLALNEENWRRYFKPIVYDSVQNGLVTTAGTGMTINVSAGECRCGAVMGVLDSDVTLDITNGHNLYTRIDSVVIQYSYGKPSTFSVSIKNGTPSANPVAPTLNKNYNTLWEMEIAQIRIPAGATNSSTLTITDKRVMYNSVQSIIDDNAGNGDTDVVWSANKSYNEITDLKNSTKGFTNLKNLFYEIITQSDNLVDLKITNHENGYYNGIGTFIQSDNYITYIIEVESSTQYYISAYRHYLTFWNDNTFISRIGTSGTVQTNQIITTPNNANIIKVSFYLLSSVDPTYIDNFMLIAGNQIPGEYISPRPTLSDYLIIPGKKEIENHNKIKYNEKFTPVFQMTLKKIISDTNGEINNTTSNNLCADEIYYPLENEKKYIFWSDAILYNIYFYDENFSFKACIYTNSNVGVRPIIYTNANDYAYFRVGGYYSQGASNVINTLHVTMTNNPKKIVCLGDSLTAGIGANIAYHMYLARYTGWTCQNWGVGGSGWATRGSNNTKVGNGIEGIPSSNSTPEYNTEFTAAVEVIPKDADLYIVFGGYNDWNTDKSETAFTNAVETTISYIQENMPSSRILVMTPTQRYKAGEKDGNIQNNAGLTIKNYCQIIKNVCGEHSVPCLDLYSGSLLYPYSVANSTEYFDTDGAHINDNGQKLVFEAMAEKAISLLALK